MNTDSKVDRINYLNIGLMFGSLGMAFLAPFEVFLFSYAVLAPLHYFSEIAWLHRRQYFSPGKYDYIWLGLLAVLLFLSQFVFTSFQSGAAGLIAFGFLFSFAVIVLKNPYYKGIAALLIILSAIWLTDVRWYFVLFAIFMTTIVHTFIFTGMFILQGALKESTFSGLLSLAVFIGCVAACFLIVPSSGLSDLSLYLRESYGPFWGVNVELMKLFQLPVESFQDLYMTPGALMVMHFVAFVYLYHFMNWFSKTSVIGWHQGSRLSLFLVFLSWFSCLGIFWYDYRTGLSVLYFFSILHVFLEFPLNHQTFLGVGRALLARRGEAQLRAAVEGS